MQAQHTEAERAMNAVAEAIAAIDKAKSVVESTKAKVSDYRANVEKTAEAMRSGSGGGAQPARPAASTSPGPAATPLGAGQKIPNPGVLRSED